VTKPEVAVRATCLQCLRATAFASPVSARLVPAIDTQTRRLKRSPISGEMRGRRPDVAQNFQGRYDPFASATERQLHPRGKLLHACGDLIGCIRGSAAERALGAAADRIDSERVGLVKPCDLLSASIALNPATRGAIAAQTVGRRRVSGSRHETHHSQSLQTLVHSFIRSFIHCIVRSSCAACI